MIDLIGAKPCRSRRTRSARAVFAQEEAAERALQAQDVALLHLAEHVVGVAAGDVADVQLDQLVGVRRVRHREAAPLAALQQEVDVLPARNCSRSFAGSLSCTIITSSAAL